ncbi:MAG: hypothetical protein WDW36_002470 [Sanguina aurantia]
MDIGVCRAGEVSEVNNRKRALEEPLPAPGLFCKTSHSSFLGQGAAAATPILTVPPLNVHLNKMFSAIVPQLARESAGGEDTGEDDSDVSAEEVIEQPGGHQGHHRDHHDVTQGCHADHHQQHSPACLTAAAVQELAHGRLGPQSLPATPSLDDLGSGVKPSNKLPRPEVIGACPRCDSNETKFAYYNNNNPHQPRFFCKSCQRYWTSGGILRNLPPGSGRRKKIKSTGPGTPNQSAASAYSSPPPASAGGPPAKKQNSSFSAITRRIVADSGSGTLAPVVPSLGCVPLHASMWAGSSGTAFSKFTPPSSAAAATHAMHTTPSANTLSPSTSPSHGAVANGSSDGKPAVSRGGSGSQVSCSVGDLPAAAALRVHSSDALPASNDAKAAAWGVGALPGLWSGSPIGSANSTDPSSCSSGGGGSEHVDLGRYGGSALGLVSAQAAAAGAAFKNGRANGSASSCSSQARAQGLQQQGRDQSNNQQQQPGSNTQRRDDANDAAAAAALLSCMSSSQQQHMLLQLQAHTQSAEQMYCAQLMQAMQQQQQQEQLQQDNLQQWLAQQMHNHNQQQLLQHTNPGMYFEAMAALQAASHSGTALPAPGSLSMYGGGAGGSNAPGIQAGSTAVPSPQLASAPSGGFGSNGRAAPVPASFWPTDSFSWDKMVYQPQHATYTDPGVLTHGALDPAAQALAAMSQWGSWAGGAPGLPAGGGALQYAEQQGHRLWDSLRQQ